MRLIFHVQPEVVVVTLFDGEVAVQSVDLTDTRSLSQTLLPTVERLLSGQGIRLEELEDVRVESQVLPGFTSYRVAETTARVLRTQMLRPK